MRTQTLTNWLQRAILALLITIGLTAHASAQVGLSTAARNAAADAVVDLVDAGAGAGVIEIRTGAAPSSANDADTGTLLATLTFSDPAFGAASSGQATASSITQDSSADATGTAGHFRVKDSNGNTVFQGSITTTGGGGVMQLVTTSITAGQPVQITSFTYTQPAS